MVTFLIFVHIIVCVFLVISILLQSSKGGGLAGMFGGGGGIGSVFGARGAATFLSKLTMWLSIAFAVTTISIALISSRVQKSKSLVDKVIETEQVASPATMLPTIPAEDQTKKQDNKQPIGKENKLP